ncbi:hypothetical protein IFM89_015722 [Coptis chinensis]|uniref:Uncharacterized protein n=1 Tax=Coptis chinensis TaxID=261450 RepID=A0A835I2L6_9MAGN|nr:hypothetical protein IFM89_015722 [Coptis chinensis]
MPKGVFRLGLVAILLWLLEKHLLGTCPEVLLSLMTQLHSVVDVVLSGVALWSFKVARAPKDKEHPYVTARGGICVACYGYFLGKDHIKAEAMRDFWHQIWEWIAMAIVEGIITGLTWITPSWL